MPPPPASPHHAHPWRQEAEAPCPHCLLHLQPRASGPEHHRAFRDRGTCLQCGMKIPVTQEVACPDCGAHSQPPF